MLELLFGMLIDNIALSKEEAQQYSITVMSEMLNITENTSQNENIEDPALAELLKKLEK